MAARKIEARSPVSPEYTDTTLFSTISLSIPKPVRLLTIVTHLRFKRPRSQKKCGAESKMQMRCELLKSTPWWVPGG